MGGRWLEAKRCRRWRERPIFQGRLDSRWEKKEGTERVGGGHGNGTGLCSSTDPGSNLSPTTYHTFGGVPLPLILTEGSLDL